MGMAIFEESGIFDPKMYGLSIGDVINIICVGSGAGGGSASGLGGRSGAGGLSQQGGGGGGGAGYGGGGGGGSGNQDNTGGEGGGSGEVKKMVYTLTSIQTIAVTVGASVAANTNGASSSFGSILTALGGEKNKGGHGGKGVPSGSYRTAGGGGGGNGGFLLALNIQGGTGGGGGSESPYNGATAPDFSTGSGGDANLCGGSGGNSSACFVSSMSQYGGRGGVRQQSGTGQEIGGVCVVFW